MCVIIIYDIILKVHLKRFVLKQDKLIKSNFCSNFTYIFLYMFKIIIKRTYNKHR